MRHCRPVPRHATAVTGEPGRQRSGTTGQEGTSRIHGLHQAPREHPAGDHGIPVSALVHDIVRDWPAERVPVGELIEALGQRGFGALIVLLALPNLLPFWVPGLSPLVGVPMLLVCAQLALGGAAPRLPRFVARRSFRRAELLAGLERASPWLHRVERFVRPRPSFITGRAGERLVGAWGILLSAIIILPTPLTNGPPALACLVMAVGMLEEDGVTILAGAAFGVFAVVFALSIVGSLGLAFASGLGWLLGLT